MPDIAASWYRLYSGDCCRRTGVLRVDACVMGRVGAEVNEVNCRKPAWRRLAELANRTSLN